MAPLRAPKASPAANSNVARVPSARPSRRCSTAGDNCPWPSDKVAGLSAKGLITSPAGPARRECSVRKEPGWTGLRGVPGGREKGGGLVGKGVEHPPRRACQAVMQGQKGARLDGARGDVDGSHESPDKLACIVENRNKPSFPISL